MIPCIETRQTLSYMLTKYSFRLWASLLLIWGFTSFTSSDKQLLQEPARVITTLTSGWLFVHGDIPDAASVPLNEQRWQKVNIPHDWAISGPFDPKNDLPNSHAATDTEQKATISSGRTGGLPFAGVGWYRKHLFIDKADHDKKFFLEFDGAMSHAKLYVNNRFAGEWPYGYTSFGFDITGFIRYGTDNVIAVRLENQYGSSRWYPGAGIYRNVRLVKTNKIHVAHWGTFITTSEAVPGQSLVNIETTIEQGNEEPGNIQLETSIYDGANKQVAVNIIQNTRAAHPVQQFQISNPQYWSAENPALYYAVTRIRQGKQLLDEYKTSFGIRSIRFTPQKGLLVNGRIEKLKGVCLHDDLGPLGMAINKSALRYRLQLLKEMGCNAIRGTHNPHAPELLELCDEMGFYYIDEAFDEWRTKKTENGYHLLFDQWAEKDLKAMILRDRNHPALIMYSIGNEIKEQGEKEGAKLTRYLSRICRGTDSTRPVTAGFNNLAAAIKNGLADAVDIPGWNYKPDQYVSLHRQHPNWIIYGSETVSTVSSRGVFQLPAVTGVMKTWPDNQSSAYDLEYCNWSQLPDTEWKNQENDFVAGEFVWTGFDYLGEPTPYNNDWPSRSSYFGIIDLCGIPKDRYYLYQSHWSSKKVLHLLPHWNWPGKENTIVPVFVYTNYHAAEVFINGKSFGKKYFDKNSLADRYRLRWKNTIYKPGELKVVAYDQAGKRVDSSSIHTAGNPAIIRLEASQQQFKANEETLVFVTASIRDKDGNLCPVANNLVRFTIKGAGTIRAVGNGNPASLEPFAADYRKAFSGKCMLIVQSNGEKGQIDIEASSNGLQTVDIHLNAIK